MTKQPFPASKPTTICVCGSEISFSSSVRNLAFYITAHDTSVELHKNYACRLAYFELRCIGSVGHLLSDNSTKTLGSAFLLSRSDCCKTLGSAFVLSRSDCCKTLGSAFVLSRSDCCKTPLSGCATQYSAAESCSKLVIEIKFYPSQVLFTGCPSYQLFVTLFPSVTAPVSLPCLLRMYIPLRQSAPLLTQQIYSFHTFRPKHSDTALNFSYAALSVWNSLIPEIRHI